MDGKGIALAVPEPMPKLTMSGAYKTRILGYIIIVLDILNIDKPSVDTIARVSKETR